ncbi:metal-dependent hydrolase, partial [Halorubrum sp. CBA1125]|uniref:metal-dependent hydrolase n=1 Tax=Halorubrum sp. CBA1125 TaxID=2668072 RepID=UPI0012E9765F
GTGSATGEPGLAALGAGLAVVAATLPDVDHRLPVAHRGPTHTLGFALGAGALAGVVTACALAVAPSVAASPRTAVFVGGVVALSLCSHLAGDAITPMGIRPFRPVWNVHVTLDLTPAKDPRANRLFLGAGVAAASLATVAAV